MPPASCWSRIKEAVSAVQVFEDDHDRLAARRLHQELHHGVVGSEAACVVSGRRSRIWKVRAQLWCDQKDLLEAPAGEPAKVIRSKVLQEGAQDLEPRPVRRRPLGLCGKSPVDR